MTFTLRLTAAGAVWLLGVSVDPVGRFATAAGIRARGYQWATGMSLTEAGVSAVTSLTALPAGPADGADRRRG